MLISSPGWTAWVLSAVTLIAIGDSEVPESFAFADFSSAAAGACVDSGDFDELAFLAAARGHAEGDRGGENGRAQGVSAEDHRRIPISRSDAGVRQYSKRPRTLCIAHSGLLPGRFRAASDLRARCPCLDTLDRLGS